MNYTQATPLNVHAGVIRVNIQARIRVTQVLKGKVLHADQVLPLCAGMLDETAIRTPNNPTVLVFIEGRDDTAWVPTQGAFGIIPQSQDGRFAPPWATNGSQSVMVCEFQRIIRSALP